VRGMTGRPALWRSERRRLLRILEAERRRDRARRLAGTVPAGVEYRFGTEDHPAVEVDAGDRALAFYGLVDRVDRLPSGALEVIDYKTGGDRYAGVTADPVDGGRHLQLALYARAAASLNGGTETVARSAFRLLEHDGREIAIVPDASVDARLTEVVAGLQRGIHAGQFPVRPGKGSRFTGLENCRFCDFVAACRVDRADQYAAIESLPELAELFALSLPPGSTLEDSAVDDG
jgi:ATP-dependent helicase/DNAse subunit B